MVVGFVFIGFVFVVGFYDVVWELEKGYKLILMYSLKLMFRNFVGEWGFVVLLMVIMIVWMRFVVLIYVLYLNVVDFSFE